MRRTELTRRTPLARKRRKQRAPGVGCQAKCRRNATGEFMGIRLCDKHRADRIWSLLIRTRDGRCMAAGELGGKGPRTCSGGLQAMHLVSRSYFATRWSPSNGRCGCAGHHKYLTEHPLEHYSYCERILTASGWKGLRDVAQFSPPMKAAEAVADLQPLLDEVMAE